VNPNLEAIRALQPDLLIGTTSGNDPSLEAQAAGIGLPLYTLHTPNVERMLASLTNLAGALGDRGKGETLSSNLRERLERVRARVSELPTPRVLFVIWGDPLIVPGSPAFLTDALRLAGGASVTADADVAHPAFDLESAIARAPEVILTIPPNLDLGSRLRSDPAWAGVPAVALDRVYVVSEAVVRPGPGVVLGIEEMARHLHPGAFDAAEAE
jgi:iron complex transport system substrate-binding protein